VSNVDISVTQPADNSVSVTQPADPTISVTSSV
jgi:hypothetical protein